MKYCGLLLFIFLSSIAIGQPLIHAHNDYQQAAPLTNALRHKVFSIEADVYLYNNKLVVAHDLPTGRQAKELPAAPTLDSLYLQPIVALFAKHNGRISSDSNYAPILMIDIKENGAAVLAKLLSMLHLYRSVFDRTVNKQAVQIVISGDRGPIAAWSSYAPMLFFDGRPYEVYDPFTLERVAFISDGYANYKKNTEGIIQAAAAIHAKHKLFRLWGYADTASQWKQVQQWGVDILNTDKVRECRESLK